MTLVTRIINYGCQVWLPNSSFIKSLIKNYKATRNLISLINFIFKQPFEKIQLRHLKYILGISCKATNVVTTGEIGVLPLFIKNVELCLRHLINIVNQNGTLATEALTEQIQSNLKWFNNMKEITILFDREITETNYMVSPSATINACNLCEIFSVGRILNKLIDEFKAAWARSVSLLSKLDFLRKVKVKSFAWEPYLDLIKSFLVRQSVARLRTSSHQLNIKTGRYHNIPRQMRQCEFCLSQMQSTGPIEDEICMLYKCKLVEELRRNALPALQLYYTQSAGFQQIALSLRLCCLHQQSKYLIKTLWR